VIPPEGVEIVQTREGRREEYRPRRSSKRRTVVTGREWEVRIGGELAGTIRYGMRTRETGPATRRYVSDRWYSPGWTAAPPGMREIERPSMREAVDWLIGIHERKDR
jgi:hypothetical protein